MEVLFDAQHLDALLTVFDLIFGVEFSFDLFPFGEGGVIGFVETTAFTITGGCALPEVVHDLFAGGAVGDSFTPLVRCLVPLELSFPRRHPCVPAVVY